MTGYAQNFEIRLPSGKNIVTALLTEQQKETILAAKKGALAPELNKEFTARTYRLDDNSVVLDFFDRTAMLFESEDDYKANEAVRFTKDKIWFLRQTLSYKIPLKIEEAQQIVNELSLKEVDIELEKDDLKIYNAPNDLFLVLDYWKNFERAAYYPSMKSIASEYDIEEALYPKGPETFTKDFIKGKVNTDLDPNEYFVYPRQLKSLIKNHELTLLETGIKIGYGFAEELLFESKRGYYIVIEDFNMPNPLSGRKIIIGIAKVFESLSAVREAQKKYEDSKYKPVQYVHFYQKLSDTYGKNFPQVVGELISQLPDLMNIDAEKLDFSEHSIDLLNESIQWNHKYDEFHSKFIYPTLAYYGEYLKRKDGGEWLMKYYKDNDHELYMPHYILPNGKEGIDIIKFYNGLYEGPVRMEWAAKVHDWEKFFILPATTD